MARPVYLPSNDSYTLSYQGEPQAGVQVKLFTRQVGGTQVTDLVYVGYDGSIGAAVPNGILTSDGFGLLPAFAGPDNGPTVLWGDHGAQGERIALFSLSGGGGGGGAVSSVDGQTGAVSLGSTYAPKLTATTKTGAYTASGGDFVLANAAGGAFDITLPPSPLLGQQVAVKKIDATANAVTVVAAGKTIDGDANAVITARWAGATFTYDGTNWIIAAPTYAGGVSFGTSAGTAAQGNDTRITGAAQKSANLTDLTDPAAARTALNLNRLFTPIEQLAASPDLMVVGAITRSATGAATAFNVVWPDGATGSFVGTESLTAAGAIDSYTVTRVVSGQPTKTFTQSTLTRDGAGAVTNRPAMTVS